MRADIEKWDQIDSPEIPHRGETSEIPHFGGTISKCHTAMRRAATHMRYFDVGYVEYSCTLWLSCTNSLTWFGLFSSNCSYNMKHSTKQGNVRASYLSAHSPWFEVTARRAMYTHTSRLSRPTSRRNDNKDWRNCDNSAINQSFLFIVSFCSCCCCCCFVCVCQTLYSQ